MKPRPGERKLPQVEFDGRTCLICGGSARPFTSAQVPELLRWVRGDIGDADLAAGVWKAFPKAEGCFVASSSGFSVCAKQGVYR